MFECMADFEACIHWLQCVSCEKRFNNCETFNEADTAPVPTATVTMTHDDGPLGNYDWQVNYSMYK